VGRGGLSQAAAVQPDPEQLERAYEAGDHAQARRIAQAILQSTVPVDTRARAQKVLEETEIDWFLPAIGGLGLGLVTYLVYNYWL
jgi:hypothetical protein